MRSASFVVGSNTCFDARGTETSSSSRRFGPVSFGICQSDYAGNGVADPLSGTMVHREVTFVHPSCYIGIRSQRNSNVSSTLSRQVRRDRINEQAQSRSLCCAPDFAYSHPMIQVGKGNSRIFLDLSQEIGTRCAKN